MNSRALVLALVGALLAPAAATAADPTATAIRIGDHPAYVRIVLDRTVTPTPNEFAVDAEIADGGAVVDVPRTRIGSLATARGLGVTVVPSQRGSALRLRITAAPGRFKYYGDRTLSRRLVMDLWKARPVFPGATVRDGRCLAIRTASPGTGRVAASGLGRGIFESQFALVVRNSAGRVAGRRAPVFVSGFPNGTWSSRVAYTVSRRQIGTLEAVDFGGRTGELCIAQIPVILRPR